MVEAQPISTNPLFKDLTGRNFGLWTVVAYGGKRGKKSVWICKCQCGTERSVDAASLIAGRSTGCDCKRKATTAAMLRTHGASATNEYTIWLGMKRRCLRPKCKSFKNYGGRGITICDRWLESFDHFLADMGERPSPMYTLERIDNDGNYEPGNCRWATRKEQCNNTRKNRLLTFDGRTMTMSEWSRETGIASSWICTLIKRGVPFAVILQKYPTTRQLAFVGHLSLSPS